MVAQRGERLELLIDKTENLVDSVSIEYDISFQGFKTTALMSKKIWKCLKSYAEVFCFSVSFLISIMSLFCDKKGNSETYKTISQQPSMNLFLKKKYTQCVELIS